jgi:Arylsulfotransferase (ASST)
VPVRLTSTLAVAAIASTAAVAALSPASSAAPTPVAVFPAKNTRVASPSTQISFRGIDPSQLTGIVVKGSVTKEHSGTLRAHSDGNGASWIPDTKFHTGEHVRVYADPPLIGEKDGYVRFEISKSPGPFSLPIQKDQGGTPPGSQIFKSRTDIAPPSLIVTKREDRAIGQGPIFVAAKAGPGQDGPMIVDDTGKLIWFKRAPNHRSIFDFRAQTYRGNPVLTWWQGKARPGQGLGRGIIYDAQYRKIAQVNTANGYEADLHEFELSSRNTALVLAYNPVTFGGEVAMDEVVQEIDIPTGLVMYEWHSLGQVQSSTSDGPHNKGQPYDVAHVNSIQLEPDGNFLISARHTNAVYELNGRTAQINWQLGGRGSDFDLSGASVFSGQHDARLQADGSITLYDNGGPTGHEHESRALWLNVDRARRKVNVRRSYRYLKALKAFSQGGMQVLPSGDVFVGWGGNVPYVSQFTAGGHMVFDAQFKPKSDDTYRAYRFPWTATPARAPDVAALKKSGNTKVYASWNGATEVARWQVLAGPQTNNMQVVKNVSAKGFETGTTITGTPAYVAVRALGPSNEALRTSAPTRPSG